MTRQQALELLGLTGEPSAEDVRRAYLRAVKACSPERDPAGFQRVREAYERLKDAGAPLAELRGPGLSLGNESVVAHAEAPAVDDAISADDPVVAAKGLMAKLAGSSFEVRALPAPFVCLQTVMLLVERGHFAEARELLQAFEAAAAVDDRAASFGPEVGARWRLVREVAALLDLDREVARAVAMGLASHDMSRAARALSWRDGSLQAQVSVQAPHIWTLLAPLVPAAPPPVANPSRLRPTWLLWLLGLVLLFVLPRVFAPKPVSENAENRSAARAAEQRWPLIGEALERGDCGAVARRWPAYSTLAKNNVDEATASERTRSIVQGCPELKRLLEEQEP